MLTLGNIFAFLLAASACAWLWHSHGLRERALALVKDQCHKRDVELLDENVAFRRFSFMRDAKGFRRFARVYDFEFTTTGEQRLAGKVVLFGYRLGLIEFAPYAVPEVPVVNDPRVVDMASWRRAREEKDDRRLAD
ncbi:DUF3301 domain-containing protein [Pseudomonas asuensis]|uniref:DUF3301 domain-containing protein n=1 Tax=Pseudomonas asuensis TaxID=1825787 RepID=A0ABQ2GN49_9PSED|nr:DUF3301 domain-containing protein [Pseudomonas asuensis]GGM03371.1 hypothetical protein GCM10009425_13320 [Pseudomonas asuensis]